MLRWVSIALLLGRAAAASPLPEDPQGRRAIRGAPVEATHESDALRALRQFDVEAFPRPGAPPMYHPADAAAPQRNHAPVDATTTPWLGQVKLPDFPVRLDERTVRYLEFYKNDKRGRAIMSGWLKAQGRWRVLFEDGLRRAKLPLALVYVAMIESGYDPHDRSHAGAVGLWQFMPEGAKIYGLRVDYWVDQRKDPERSTEAVTHYLADLKERFGGWPLALAAFNAGYGAVLRSMQKYNTNDYWELCRHEDGLPWETMLYVPKAMAAAVVGENRALFGYAEVPAEAPFAFDRITVPSSTSLTAIARAAGVSAAELEALNPELRRKRTPPDPGTADGRWEVRVPPGAGARFAAAFGANRELVKPFMVRFGERLEDLAREVGSTVRELRTLNGIEDLAEIRPGLTLVVPTGREPVKPTPCDTVIVAVPDKNASVAGRKRVFYRALPNDSIQDISVFFGVRPGELVQWNNLDLDARLAAGMVLQLWVARDFDVTRAALVDPTVVRVVTTGSEEFFDLVEARRGRARLVYTVKKGDDLKKIGKKYGLTVADLERINRFGAAHTSLAVGQRLIVYRPMTPAEREKAACKLTPGGTDAIVRAPAADEAAHAPAEAEPTRAPAPDEAAAAPKLKDDPPGDETAETPPKTPASDEEEPLPLKKLPRLPGGKESAARP
jgi:membrane-bound lytic murein transglycosylase D